MGRLDGKVSEEDRQRVNDIRNPPQYEAGFEGGGDGFDDIFGSSGGGDGFNMDDIFGTAGGDSGDPFGNSGSSGDPFGQTNNGGFGGSSSPFGSSNAFGATNGSDPFNASGGNNTAGGQNNVFGNSSFGGNNPFNSPFGQQNPSTQQETKPDIFDRVVDTGAETAKGIGEILAELFKSLRLRSADDFGYLSRNSIITGLVMVVIGIVVGIIGTVSGITMLSFNGIGIQSILSGGLLFATGMVGLGTSALILEKIGRRNAGTIENIDNIPAGEDNFTDDYENNIGDEMDDLFSDDEMAELFGDEMSTETSNFGSQDVEETFETDMDISNEELDFETQLAAVNENQFISRENLFNTFKQMLPKCTPQFSEKKEIDKSSGDFSTLETICLKALANIANCQLEEVNSYLDTAYESFFSYELRLKRVNKVKKVDDLAKEIEAYMKDSSDDDSVNATVDIEGDFYKILVTKGVTAVVTFGDVFTQDYCCDFYLNTKNKLPMIVGIDELGKVIVDDAKNFDTMLIAGKPRSGKSWYVLSVLMSLMLFNSPEDVQLCIIDPKESNLFKTIALMPHVCGLHNDERILEILDDIIEIEAPRRKHLLAENRCDDIWALRKKGINLPILYVVIDEYITVINNLDKDGQKEFDNKIQILISQLPSQGVRLIFVPHRAMGIVNKTNRTMLQYTAAVRADTADVIDTLGIQKWNRALTMPGDIAVKTATMKNATYVRGAALTNDDGDNTIFIETAAKVFYKMGVDIPDMSNMRIATNRDEEYIKNELAGNANRVQFNADDIDNEVNNMDFSNID